MINDASERKRMLLFFVYVKIYMCFISDSEL